MTSLARLRAGRLPVGLCLLLALSLILPPPNPAAAQGVRNPFGVADVLDPVGPDVQALAARVRLPGGPDDRNAPQWAPGGPTPKTGGLEGEWFGRWELGTHGSARIRVTGNRLFALYGETAGRLAGRTWILEAQMESEGRLVGRWVQVGNPRDTGPFIGRIVEVDRIDGIWSWDGGSRWDFRRRLD